MKLILDITAISCLVLLVFTLGWHTAEYRLTAACMHIPVKPLFDHDYNLGKGKTSKPWVICMILKRNKPKVKEYMI